MAIIRLDLEVRNTGEATIAKTASSMKHLGEETKRAEAEAKKLQATMMRSAGIDPVIAKASSAMNGLGGSFASSTSRAAAFADSVGRVSTTLARSADVFGLPVGALRALDDAADVAELGLNNLSKSAVGFNAASIGVVGAGAAIGVAIGSWLRTFPAVAKVADDLGASLHKLFSGTQGAVKQNFLPGEMDKIKESFARVQNQLKEQIKAERSAGASMDALAAKYKTARPEVQALIDTLTKEEAAQRKVVSAREQAIKSYIAGLPDGADEAARFDMIAAAVQRLGATATGGQLTKIADDLRDMGEALKETVSVSDTIQPIQIGGDISTTISDTALLQSLMRDLGMSYDEASAALGKLPGETQAATAATIDWHDALDNIANSFAMLGSASGPIGDVLGLLGQAAGLTASIGANIDTINKSKKAGGFAGAMGSIAGGLGIVTSVIGFISGIFGRARERAEELRKAQEEAMDALIGAFDQWKQARSELAGKGAEAVNSLLGSLFDEDGKFTGAFTSAANAAEYVAASFAMLRAAGMTTAQALAAMKPSLDAMRKDPSKFAGTGAEALLGLANAAEAHAAALQFIAGIGLAANALAGFGMLTQDLATRMSQDMAAAIQGMIDAGVPYEQALALNAQALYDLAQAAEQSGVTLDEHTRQLIEDARAAGLFEGLEDPMQSLIRATQGVVVAIGEVVRLMGGQLPESLRRLIDEFNQASRGLPAPPPGSGGGGGAEDGGAEDEDGESRRGNDGSRAFGGPIPRPGRYRLHAGERVLTPPQARAWEGRGERPGINITFGNINGGGGDPRKIAEEVARAIERRVYPRLNRAVSR